MYLTENLSQQMIDAGAELTKQLDRSMMIVKASFWYLVSDERAWRLIIATPEVHTSGPRKVYQRVQTALGKLQMAKKGLIASAMRGLSLEDIVVVEPSNPLIILLGQAVGTDKGISHIRFSNNTVGGQFIEDAYIYRLMR